MQDPLKNSFWNQLFFWVTIIVSIKAYYKYRAQLGKNKARITINGKEYYAKHITIKDGYIFLDGKYISPGDIEKIVIEESD